MMKFEENPKTEITTNSRAARKDAAPKRSVLPVTGF